MFRPSLCCGFFRRKRLDFDFRTDVEFPPAEPVNYDAFLFAPVVNGMWRQHEAWDGTYTLSDLLDAHEMMIVKAENERRYDEYAEMYRKH